MIKHRHFYTPKFLRRGIERSHSLMEGLRGIFRGPFFLLFFIFALPAAAERWEPDTIYKFRENENDTIYKKTVKFNQSGNTEYYIEDELHSYTWYRDKRTYLYDSNNNLTGEKQYRWRDDSGGWYELRDSVKYAYDTQNRQIAREQSLYSVTQGQWVWNKCSRDSTLYDERGNLLIQSRESGQWVNNNFMNIWRKNEKIISTYSPTNKVLTQITLDGGRDEIQNKWTEKTRVTYTYDARDSIVTEENESLNWDETEWMKSRIRYEYTQTRLTTYRESYINNAWVTDYRYDETYTVDGEYKTKSIRSFTYENGNVVPLGGNTYVYTLSDSIISENYVTFADGNYKEVWRYDYSYNSKNLLESVKHTRYGYDSSDPVTGGEDYYEYDERDRLIKKTEKEREEDTGPLVDMTVYEYSYDTNGYRNYELKKVRENAALVHSEEIVRSYGSEGELLSETVKQRDVMQNQLVNVSRKTFEYDENNNATLGKVYIWDGTNWAPDTDGTIWMYYNKMTTIFYSQHASQCRMSYTKTRGDNVGMEEISDLPGLVSLYPNPATDYINLKANGCIIKQITIYNLPGMQVKQSDKNILNISSLPAGNYILRIVTDKGEVNKKMMKK